MVTIEDAIRFALSLPEAVQQPHFDKESFRVRNKIFATYHPDTGRFVLKLSVIDQSVFCGFDKTVFYPVNGAWGKQGWTYVDIRNARKEMFEDALRLAWLAVAPAKIRN